MIRWKHAALMGEKTSACKIMFVKPKGNETSGFIECGEFTD
jgi:hypothetical protein